MMMSPSMYICSLSVLDEQPQSERPGGTCESLTVNHWFPTLLQAYQRLGFLWEDTGNWSFCLPCNRSWLVKCYLAVYSILAQCMRFECILSAASVGDDWAQEVNMALVSDSWLIWIVCLLFVELAAWSILSGATVVLDFPWWWHLVSLLYLEISLAFTAAACMFPLYAVVCVYILEAKVMAT